MVLKLLPLRLCFPPTIPACPLSLLAIIRTFTALKPSCCQTVGNSSHTSLRGTCNRRCGLAACSFFPSEIPLDIKSCGGSIPTALFHLWSLGTYRHIYELCTQNRWMLLNSITKFEFCCLSEEAVVDRAQGQSTFYTEKGGDTWQSQKNGDVEPDFLHPTADRRWDLTLFPPSSDSPLVKTAAGASLIF